MVTFLMFVVAGVLVLGGNTLMRRRRVRRIAEQRPGEGICQFARSFPRRMVEPRLLRVVHGAIGEWMVGKPGGFPVRASDPLDSVCGIYPDLLDDFGEDVASAAGRTLLGAAENPYSGRVHTVRDLVMFLHHQPHVRAAV